MPAEKGGRETRLTIITRADKSRMNSALFSLTVVTSMSTLKVKWLNDSRYNTTHAWERHSFNNEAISKGAIVTADHSKGIHVHFINSVFENIFSIGTSCFLDYAAAILCAKKEKKI
jgi:hypothetical protein